MPRYQDQLEEEVKRSYMDRHSDAFHLQGDKAKLTPSYGSLYHALGNVDDDMDETWNEAVEDYKRMRSSRDDDDDDDDVDNGGSPLSSSKNSPSLKKFHRNRKQEVRNQIPTVLVGVL